MQYSVWTNAALGLLALLACFCPVGASALGESDELTRQHDSMHHETIEPDGASFGFERSDCLLGDAICRSECGSVRSRRECDADPCSSRLALCLATLPLGKFASLPMTCRPVDQDAFQRLERQGELLDADPVLFAHSYRTFIRARIACRAGNHEKALVLYDEVLESMREKQVPSSGTSKLAR
jgi:hypothetical protein